MLENKKNVPNTVLEIIKWKLGKLINGRSVEDYNIGYTNLCGGATQTDVLYSFLSIFSLGIYAYNNNVITGPEMPIMLENSNNSIKIRSKAFLKELLEYHEENDEYSLKNEISVYIYEYNESKEKKEIKINIKELVKFLDEKFCKCYFSVGNLIPIWPGGNSSKGCNFIDIPNLYFNRYINWFNFLKQIDYSYLDELVLFNFQTTELFYKKISSEKEYKSFVCYVNKFIIERKKSIKKYFESDNKVNNMSWLLKEGNTNFDDEIYINDICYLYNDDCNITKIVRIKESCNEVKNIEHLKISASEIRKNSDLKKINKHSRMTSKNYPVFFKKLEERISKIDSN